MRVLTKDPIVEKIIEPEVNQPIIKEEVHQEEKNDVVDAKEFFERPVKKKNKK